MSLYCRINIHSNVQLLYKNTYILSYKFRRLVFDMWQYIRHKWKCVNLIIFFSFFWVAPGWSICRRNSNVTGRPLKPGQGLLWHHVWACLPAGQVCNTNPVLLTLHSVTKHCRQHGPVGSEWICNAPKPISSELKLGRAILCSHIQNSNQISSQSSGINATLHLTLK